MKKKITIVFTALLYVSMSSFTLDTETLTKEDRKTLIKNMKESQNDLIDLISGLTKEQWRFKPSEEV